MPMRILCVVLIASLLLHTSCLHPAAARPVAGRFDFQAATAIEVPGGVVNAVGGNLSRRFVSHSIDTIMGVHEVAVGYNSATNAWLWSFDVTYDGATFVDESGAAHVVGPLAPGAAIPGSHWVKLDATRLATRGGLVHTFRAVDGGLATVGWANPAYPFVAYLVESVSGSVRTVGAEQCWPGQGCQSLYEVFYDEHGCVERVIDRADRVALFSSDASCRLITARDGLDVAQGWPGDRYEYSRGPLSAATNSEGERVEYAYFSGRLVRAMAIGEGNPQVRFAYGYSSSRESYYTLVVGTRDEWTVYRYDDAGRLWEKADAVGGLTRLTWNGLRPASLTDAAGLRTDWAYEDDDPVAVSLPSGNTIAIEYAAGARNLAAPLQRPIVRITDSLGLVVENEYDADGNLVRHLNGSWESEEFEYDASGNVRRRVAPDGVVTEFEGYGAHGHPTYVVHGGAEDFRMYDAVGNLVEGSEIAQTTSPGRPGIRRRFFDADRNVVTIELEGRSQAMPDSSITESLTIEYRSDRRRKRILRPGGGDTEYVYDDLGRVAARRERVDGAWSTTSYSYDASGDLRASELANGMRREADYDAMGRPVAVRLLRDGVLESSSTLEYAGGRLVTRGDSTWGGSETFSYDGAGRLSTVVFPGGEMLQHAYDQRSRPISKRYWARPYQELIRELEFEYDGADRRTAVYDGGDLVVERTYRGGRESWIHYGNGLVRNIDWSYSSGLIESIETREADGDLLETTTLDWFVSSYEFWLESTTTIVGTDENPNPSVSSETYGIGKIPVQATAYNIAGPRLLFSHGVRHHDPLGNLFLSDDYLGDRSEMHFNAEGNRLLSAELGEPHGQGSRSYAYDAAGFLTSRNGQAFSWDAGGRIRTLDNGDTFEWDVLGRLVSSVVGGVSSKTRFGGEVRGDANGNPVSIELRDARIDLTTGARIYRHFDFRENVKFVTSDSGEVLLHYQYSGYGVEAVFGGYPDTMSFAGGTEVGGLVLLGARVYDPETARFISPDPIHHVVNQYAYTLGNPITLWDPGGLQAQPMGGSTVTTRLIQAMATVALGLGLVFTGAAMAVSSLTFGLIGGGLLAIYVGLSVFGPSIEDCGCSVSIGPVPPDGGLEPAAELASSTAIATACSPSSIQATSAPAMPLHLALGLQLLAATMLLRRRRHERS